MMLEMKSDVANCEQIGFHHKRRNVEDKKKYTVQFANVSCSLVSFELFITLGAVFKQ